MSYKNKVLLSFDLEEFDIPLEYGIKVSKKEQIDFTLKGLNELVNLLDKQNISTTFFVTGTFAEKNKKLIKNLSKNHEIASHNMNHNSKKYNEKEALQSKKILERITGKKIKGFRFPRLQKPDFVSLKKLGYKYDSSICPTWLPGRYNNYFEKREITIMNGIKEFPVSVLPIAHAPLYWLFFRFFGFIYARIITVFCMTNPGFTNLFFHPWEFNNNLKDTGLPFYVKRNSGKKAIKMLEKYILWCKKKKYKFVTFSNGFF